MLLLLPSLLSGPGNASDARILQERALILLRHPHSLYMPGYCAYNKWEVCSQPQTQEREKGKQELPPREFWWIQQQQENFRSKGMKGGTGQPNFSPGAFQECATGPLEEKLNISLGPSVVQFHG